MKPVDYDVRMHDTYVRARAMDAAQLAQWIEVFGTRLPSRRPLSGLDLGSGTGRLTPALAQTFGPMVGVEPSDRMREIAQRESADPAVRYVPGSAEDIPLESDSVDFTVMFLAWHHVGDKDRAAAELARVTRPGGTLLLRTQFSDRMPHLWWLEHFPRGREADASMYDSTEEMTTVLEGAGWRTTEIAEVTVQQQVTMQESLDRLRLRTFSTFEQLTEQEIAEGFARLERTVAATPDAPAPAGPATFLVAQLP
ncbi:class I SAM-dependent methyltransferase [Luteipulveratus mongoliensis]|uniref:Methyltransferase type 11 n=1 Tax=Luteipulveratus mongoliensis TaxID=571913 RepID=A0A0K1JKH5_9MICO|nr:class I SAM-dependent methyltransferase [Luteipulveratus mongoliensis]AKU17098.1 methyltransferase type 11 [Luteipulveratus mongoliensis]